MSSSSGNLQLSPDVLAHVVDVHCHPTDSVIPDSIMDSLALKICAMATKQADQGLVRELANKWPDNVIPCFGALGYHPWFTHWIAVEKAPSKEEHYRKLFIQEKVADTGKDTELLANMLHELPDPLPLEDVLLDIRRNFEDFPTAMLGEVGLDRAFRVPVSLGPDGPRKLSPFTVPLDHQLKILEAQLDLAVEFKRNVSLHSVKAQQVTVQLIDRLSNKYNDRWDAISIDMHSCGLSPEKSHPNVFLSLSTGINGRSPVHRTLIQSCDPKRILAESDFHDIHECSPRVIDMIHIIAEIRGWYIEMHWDDSCPEDEWGVVRHLEENWKAFFRGSHFKARKTLLAGKQNRKFRKEKMYDTDERLVSSIIPLDTTESGGGGWSMTIDECAEILTDCHIGDSISINGACLTVTEFTSKSFKVGLAPETLEKTDLGTLKTGSYVNLERAMAAHVRFGGHFVQGHVDGIATIVEREPDGNSLRLLFQLPKSSKIGRYIIPKGFIAIDGTSLTITSVNDEDATFGVMLIAHTQSKVTLSQKNIGESVNIEVDMLGKYVERAVKAGLEGSVLGSGLQDVIERTVEKILRDKGI
ncbi:hypothetical protein Clacol_007481 [Clathrus columnatus]|uniref:Riboflavin synthase n=1 Tax=Clathrus columnatus TaxID=1419009 RepID=A0AAV5AFY5_9AGAM|nr:hypothetical protein Clacol_007481 [Clathrus columnatus]